MIPALQEKLQALRAEYDTGQKMLAELDAKRASVTSMLLQLQGAITVLKELTEPAVAAPLGPTVTSSHSRDSVG